MSRGGRSPGSHTVLPWQMEFTVSRHCPAHTRLTSRRPICPPDGLGPTQHPILFQPRAGHPFSSDTVKARESVRLKMPLAKMGWAPVSCVGIRSMSEVDWVWVVRVEMCGCGEYMGVCKEIAVAAAGLAHRHSPGNQDSGFSEHLGSIMWGFRRACGGRPRVQVDLGLWVGLF